MELVLTSYCLSVGLLVAAPIYWCRTAPGSVIPAVATSFFAGQCISWWLRGQKDSIRHEAAVVSSQVRHTTCIFWYLVCVGFSLEHERNVIAAVTDPAVSLLSLDNRESWILLGLLCIFLLVAPVRGIRGGDHSKLNQTVHPVSADRHGSAAEPIHSAHTSYTMTSANVHADFVRRYIESGPGP